MRCASTCDWLGGSDLAEVRDIGFHRKLCGNWSRRRIGWSGRAGARRLQGCGPPQQIVDQRPGRRLQLGQPGVDIAALIVSPQGGDRDVDRRANWTELKLDRRFAKL